MRSTRSPEPPEFFIDRCLGKKAPQLLTGWGWSVHLIADHYPNDAQEIPDEQWIEEGLRRGWPLLTQDDRITRQPAALELLMQYDGLVFCLDSGQLTFADKANRFHACQATMYQLVRRPKPGFFHVTAIGLDRRWPRHGRR
ncbi:hypothetical protein [Dactylosporangium sp. CS-033363]|uniref:PIN-like domain-containing protein n=1 Tax=Dactylosporangium sp. CS-033363 TaxID=3239935 RepID=UPI003D8C6FD0